MPTTLSCHITYITSTDAPNLIPHPAPNQPVQFFVDGIEVGQSVTNENGYAQIPYTFATPGVHTVRTYSATTIAYDSMNAALGRWSVDVTTSITVLQTTSSPAPSPSVLGLPTGITAPVNKRRPQRLPHPHRRVPLCLDLRASSLYWYCCSSLSTKTQQRQLQKVMKPRGEGGRP